MKILSGFGVVLFLLGNQAAAIQINYQINYQVYQNDSAIQKAFGGKNNGDMLCWPSSLAHRMKYLKAHGFPRLKLSENDVDNVRKFVSLCRTSLTGGTSQKRKLPCIEQAFKEARYSVKTYSIGSDSLTAKRPVELKDLEESLSSGSGTILHIAWMRKDSVNGKWTEKGSHSLNAYSAIKIDAHRINLEITNPGVDYSMRLDHQMFDTVEVGRSDISPMLELVGSHFRSDSRRALIKNVYVFTAAEK